MPAYPTRLRGLFRRLSGTVSHVAPLGQVQAALAKVMRGRSTICIAHRSGPAPTVVGPPYASPTGQGQHLLWSVHHMHRPQVRASTQV